MLTRCGWPRVLLLNPTVWQSLSVCMSPAPSADKRAKRPPGRRGQRGDGWHGAQLIARATPAVQRAEREILNLRLCSAHPHIIHMHEVRSLLARMPASCLGLPNLPRPPGVAKALRQNDASAAAGSLHLAARSAPSPATHACTSGGAGRGVTRAHVTCLFWTHRTITRAAPGAPGANFSQPALYNVPQTPDRVRVRGGQGGARRCS